MAEALAELRRVLREKAEVHITFISKTDASYSDPGNEKEEEGSDLPHFFVDRNDIRLLLEEYSILSLRHIEEISRGKTSWHYFVHCAREG